MLKVYLEINKIINLTELRYINYRSEIPRRLMFLEYTKPSKSYSNTTKISPG